jgi:hypothetical protein
MRGDAAARGAFYKQMFEIGAFSPNDIREKEDLDPVPGGEVHLVPLNMVPLENVGKVQPKDLAQQSEPAPAVPGKTPPKALESIPLRSLTSAVK